MEVRGRAFLAANAVFFSLPVTGFFWPASSDLFKVAGFFVFTLQVVALFFLSVGCQIAYMRGKLSDSLSSAAKYSVILVMTSFVFGAGSFALLGLAKPSLPKGSYERRFDSNTWLKAESYTCKCFFTEREQMVGDLVDEILPARTKGNIEALLGPPQYTREFLNLGQHLTYFLGPKRHDDKGQEVEWLLIWLDDEGTYSKFKIVTR